MLALLKLLLSDVASHHRPAVLIDAVGKVLAGQAVEQAAGGAKHATPKIGRSGHQGNTP